MDNPSIPESILIGCTQLETVEGYQQLQDLYWYGDFKNWILQFSINVSGVDGQSIPHTTNWYMLIDPLYPRGSIGIYPDKVNSITQTYQHMNENKEVNEIPWRLGKICTDWDNGLLELLSDTEEQMDADQRISWHVERLKNWLLNASNHSLARPGDFFELPHVHFSTELQIVFAEEQKNISYWNGMRNRSGWVSLKEISEYQNILFVSAFLDNKSNVIHEYEWGKLVHAGVESKHHNGVWLLLPFQPILEPWYYPKTIKELEAICKKHHFDLWREIYRHMYIFREQEQHNYLLLGFQIPQLVGEQNVIVHWISIEIGKLAKKVNKITGFRRANDFYFQRDRINLLHPDKSLRYVRTENWSKESVLSRGSINEKTHHDGVFLIGAGALGSAIGELLSRIGISKIIVCDKDILKVGNLSRHTLGINHLSMKKAEALSYRINYNNVHTWSVAINSAFPNLSDDEVEVLESQDIIIDTTGSDAVIDHLYSFDWTIPKRFVSVSLGFGAKRMFIFLSNKHPFPRQSFYNFLKPWIELEREENKDIILPRDGIGCYHPLFPARADDIWMMAGLAIKEIEAWWLKPFGPNIFAVYEQQHIDGLSAGVLLKQREVF
ncbi:MULTISPECIES: ThiF family adenylyltransferase [Paenibacillus]|uniref:Uncharacterized protein n=1 Tax=Paenibacillus odorifer TaxID=189426 RepID=A0A1R0X393_9BACL|nr:MULTISPECIES: ThiF family adenylyltransferase [Paenibacillus]ETT61199.1 thiazole biosynthesis adenylyltransferase ThiF [Paenibacillus sp. FSL H8-237]MEC0134720.1 ThiF family adenylyltransferase [Paenibacillus odorifer]MEC0221923.1 ThiF family adenylyltransferase [Paenibacillus odorifer]OMD26481.1 hypothetical protein BJP48_22890 [Paenibacillus odorifer]OMD27688.1 hypothetical protein BJP51_24545 [Paenibacillus odorifer]